MRFVKGFALLIVFVFWGCQEHSGLDNESPSISMITFNPSMPVINSYVSLNAIATDADGDSLTYNWISLDGSFSGSVVSNPISWKSDIPGEFEITCIVSDGIETNTESIIVTVTQSVGTVYGYIYDYHTHESLGGVTVTIGGLSTITDEAGDYSISNLPTGSNILLTLSREGYEDYSDHIFINTIGNSRNYAYRKLSGKVTGYIYDSTTLEPIYDAQISTENRYTYSGSNGFYSLNELFTGPAILWIMKNGYATVSDTVEVIAGELVLDYYIESE